MKLTQAGSSPLDEAGIEGIKANRAATFDLTDGSLTRADVGLTDASVVPVITVDEAEPIAVTLKMSGGEVTIEAATLKLFGPSNQETIDTITVFQPFDDSAKVVSVVQESVEKYGVDAARVEQWVSEVERSPETGHSTYLPEGTALGSSVQIGVHWDAGKPRQVLEYTVSP